MSTIDGIIAPAFTLPVPATTVSQNLIARGTLVIGYSFVETTGAAPASIDLIDGNDANGAVVAVITLDPGQSIRDTFSGDGVYFQSGPFLKVNSGSVRGAIWQVDVERAQAMLAGSLAR